MGDEMKRGWYSEMARERGHGLFQWAAPDGTPVLVTNVGDGTEYHWPDKIDCGPVTRWLATLERPKGEMIEYLPQHTFYQVL